jgi:hypothetical protein
MKSIPSPVPSAMERMVSSLLASAGIDIKQVIGTLQEAANAVRRVDARLDRIETELTALRRELPPILAAGRSEPGSPEIADRSADNGAMAPFDGAAR